MRPPERVKFSAVGPSECVVLAGIDVAVDHGLTGNWLLSLGGVGDG